MVEECLQQVLAAGVLCRPRSKNQYVTKTALKIPFKTIYITTIFIHTIWTPRRAAGAFEAVQNDAAENGQLLLISAKVSVLQFMLKQKHPFKQHLLNLWLISLRPFLSITLFQNQIFIKLLEFPKQWQWSMNAELFFLHMNEYVFFYKFCLFPDKNICFSNSVNLQCY